MISLPHPTKIQSRCYKHNTTQDNRRPVHVIHTHLCMVRPESPETSESSVQCCKDIDRKSIAAERPASLRDSARSEAFCRRDTCQTHGVGSEHGGQLEAQDGVEGCVGHEVD